MKKLHKHLHRHWKRWPYKHTTLLVIALAVFILFLDSAIMVAFFEWSTHLGYIGAFIGGMLLVSLFTATPGVVILFELGKTYDPWGIILWGTLGCLIGDYLILNIFEDKFVGEFNLIMRKLGLKRVMRTMRTKRYRLFEALIGFAIVASPIPDEIGLALLDISHMSKVKILLLCAVANAVGIAAIVGVAQYAV